ncbi:MAG TPA: [protein-PII] uridylyltransferase, partial [Rhodobacter sp.]|nr:[protein-PII] uridylyltransferase [Rhodobacter sp.]
MPTPGSEAAASLDDFGQPLILPRDEIIDADRILNDIMAACEIAGEAADVRKITVRHLAAAKLKGNAVLAGAFEVTPKTARALVAAQVHLTDALVRIAYRV